MVCSQVHCGPAIEALRHAEYGEGSGPIWMDNIQCTEQDVVLEECDFAGWGIHNCGHSEDASVRCEGVASFKSARQIMLQPTFQRFHNSWLLISELISIIMWLE